MIRPLLAVLFAVGTLPIAGSITQASDHLCTNYPSQAAAQAAYRADPVGHSSMDADSDGIACETRPAPRDLTPVRPAPPVAPATPVPPIAAAPAPSQAVWSRGYPEVGPSGCVEYVAAWSDGTYTATPWDCGGRAATRGSATANRGYPQLNANGCTEYVTAWSDGSYSWVPFECPPGVVYTKP